jgi:tetratricopeptide (TPR) repeat protein
MGLPYYYARQYDRSIEEFGKTFNVNQTLPLTHVLLGQAYVQKGKFDEAIDELQRARQLEDSPQVEAILAHILAVSNRKSEAQKLLTQIKEVKDKQIPSYFIAMIYVGLGDKDQAMAWLERAYVERSGWLVLLRVEPRWDSLRKDQRFKDLEKRIGL